ncbi:MAG: N-acetylmuramoyl-L-alanine amidase [Anaerocolumna aminovalerica]|jgi:N-acetylmuramoyl-L-alanine amidase|uniref:N-acetylmuramoyl-L-alanine amidase family protein n=1 Tax=Anaerocolumna aminovalerica TaxID=1527 RepID=UPI000BE2BFF3|nr:N-acetylmuramoyl-L-alanine amidase [Anaerocolumna aminovalerica]MDU6266679.1 N-acetylmuramoyl-L-alanine amidase [Anaerocolumna aminovalerica]
MNDQRLKLLAIHSLTIMLVVIVIAIAISPSNQQKIYADENINKSKSDDSKNTQLEVEVITDGIISKDELKGNTLGDKYLVIKKDEKSLFPVNFQDYYMDRSIEITVKGLKDKTFYDSSILRVNGDKTFVGLPAITEEETLDFVKSFHINYTKSETTGLYTAVIYITFNNIYASLVYQDDENIYIDLRRPKDVYDKIIVVDAGHGGTDPGTYSQGEEYYEKEINLSIVLYLQELLDREDIKVYYTRTSDETIFLNPRVYFANDVEADFFISIHCNGNESSEPRGGEVLYNDIKLDNGFTSEQLAQICLDELISVTHNVNRGLVKEEEVIIVKKAKMPMALLEVGFMSNTEEMDFLAKERNRRDIAKGIHKAIMKAYEELENYN